jgi:uncharacterized protein YbjT (DUF2867 family)
MAKKVLVMGATGRTGSELVKLLSQNGNAVRAATRNPLKFQGNAEAVEFDYEKPRTFAPALAGVEKVFLIARPTDNHSDKAAMPFIDEAKKAGVQHIVDLTAMGVEQEETFMLRVLEKYIEASGIPYTHLRPNWFMQNLNSGPMYADIRATGGLHLPAADAAISFIDLRDIAAVAFKVLTGPDHAGKAYTLTGKESLSYYQVAEKLSRVSGRKITYFPITEEIARAALTKAKVPADIIERWADFHRKVRSGFSAPVTNDVEQILGRPPILFDQYAEENAGFWK